MPDGANPWAGLVKDSNGNLYGTTVFGGSAADGIVFKVSPTGKENVLYSFQGSLDGAAPYATLIIDPSRNLYGTTSAGGGSTACSGGCGTIFKLTNSGGTWKEIVLHRFKGLDGAVPYGQLFRDSTGNLYGTTMLGGSVKNCLYLGQTLGCGTIFKLDTTGKLTVLYNFTGKGDGSEPAAGLARDSAGNFYGTTVYGGNLRCNSTVGCGTVFRLSTTNKESVLHRFSGAADGANPMASLLLQQATRTLYGTASIGGDQSCSTQEGGGPGCGTVFKLTF